ncbi:hypothetical protein [uncultured Algoriphagus sp.]|uniref:hypothetical protein n=1 Tax=uncultured Algoriphagus sp. TaxID=417365 RepID=UPI00258E2F19|nr:hypothetical protein [uncultured Algoriphagus sp.]
MAKTSKTFIIQYKLAHMDLSSLKRLIKEIKSITGLKPDKVLDSENNLIQP